MEHERIIKKNSLLILAKYTLLIALIVLTGCEVEGATANHFLTTTITNNITNNITISSNWTTDQNDDLNTTGSPTFVDLTTTDDVVVGDDIQLDDASIVGYNFPIGFTNGWGLSYSEPLSTITLTNSHFIGFDEYKNTFTSTANDGKFNFDYSQGTAQLCTGATCGTIQNFIYPNANAIDWTDLTDHGTFTDGKYCVYEAGDSRISCNYEGGSTSYWWNNTEKDELTYNGSTHTTRNISLNGTINKNVSKNNAFLETAEIDFLKLNGTINGTGIFSYFGGNIIDVDLTLTTQNNMISNGQKFFDIIIDTTDTVSVPDNPFSFKTINSKSGQSYTEGFFSTDVDCEETILGASCISMFTKARVTGAGDGIGYKGYATNAGGPVGNHTGELIGVQGYAFPYSVAAQSSAVVGIDSKVFAAENIADEDTYSFRGVLGHMLLSNGGIIIAGKSGRTEDVNTEFLDFNTTEAHLFVLNDTELQGTTFLEVPHAEMWNYTSAASPYTFEIDAADTYYNLTGLTGGNLSGFTCDNSTLTATYDGLYLASLSMSFESENAGGLYGIAIVHNYDVDTHRDCYARRDAATSVGNVGITCLLDLNAGDVINIQVENENTARDMHIHTINFNLVRMGHY